MFYNINNLGSKTCDFFKDVLKQNCDIFCFAETHHLKQCKTFGMSERYSFWDQKGTKFAKKGRAKRGMMVAWKKKFDADIDVQICGVNVIKVSLKFIGNRYDIYFAYFGPESVFDSKCIEFFESVRYEERSVAILGDLNARLGELSTLEEQGRQSKDSKVNRRGRLLIDELALGGYEIANGNSLGDEVGNFSFVHRNGVSKSVLDYAVFKNVTISRFEVLPLSHSDHFPICLWIPSKEINKLECTSEVTSKYLIQNEAQIIAFREEIEDHLENITIFDDNVDTLDTVIKNAVETVARNTGILRDIRIRKGNINYPKWFDNECRELKKGTHKCLRQWRITNKNEDLEKYIETNKSYSISKKKKKDEHNTFTEEALYNHKDSKNFWKAIKSLSYKKRAVNEIDKKTWEEYYQKVYKHDQPEMESEEESEDVSVEEFSTGEIETAVKKTACKKAAGADNIPNEMWKIGTVAVVKQLRNLFNKCYATGKVPKSWCTSLICPIYKKGERNIPSNYRPISLLPTILKIFTTLITWRVQNIVDNEEKPKLSEFQAGFRRGRGCEDQIFTLQCIIQSKLRKKGGRLYACFVDFTQAFDSISHEKLWQKLQDIGLPLKLIRTVRYIYKTAAAKIRTNEGLTDEINITKGVLQGEKLSPNLFSIFINDLVDSLLTVVWSPIKMLKKTIVALLYADDLVLLANNPMDLQRQLQELEDYTDRNKMAVNIAKTKIVIFRRGGRLRKADQFTYKGKKVEIVNQFVYLGVPFRSSGKLNAAATYFKKKGYSAIGATLNIIGRLRLFKLESWKRIFESLVQSTTMYCIGIWGNNKTEEVEKVQMSFYKGLLKIPRATPNYLVRLELGLQHTKVRIVQEQLRLLYRILANDRLSLARECLHHLSRHGSKDTEYNWIANLKYSLDQVEMGFVIETLDPQTIQQSYQEILDRLKEYFWNKDLLRVQNSNSHNHYAKYSEMLTPEPYLLLHMPRVFTTCAASLRLNPYHLRIGDIIFAPQELESCQCKFCPEAVSIKHILNCPSKSDDTCPTNLGDSCSIVSSNLSHHAYKTVYVKCKTYLQNL